VRHDRGQHGADVFGRRLLALSRREEIAGKAKLIVDFDPWAQVGLGRTKPIVRDKRKTRMVFMTGRN
jgi:hypothetical protein